MRVFNRHERQDGDITGALSPLKRAAGVVATVTSVTTLAAGCGGTPTAQGPKPVILNEPLCVMTVPANGSFDVGAPSSQFSIVAEIKLNTSGNLQQFAFVSSGSEVTEYVNGVNTKIFPPSNKAFSFKLVDAKVFYVGISSIAATPAQVKTYSSYNFNTVLQLILPGDIYRWPTQINTPPTDCSLGNAPNIHTVNVQTPMVSNVPVRLR